ncbi:MAG: hypothetical protein F4Z12_07985, partial [Acidobacteria bacterium]|nr:hypothetical protein [Acidobacteriota bacterium]
MSRRAGILFIAAFGLAGAASAAAQGFTEVTEEAGIRFVHDAGDEGNFSLPEITGAGAGFF